MSGSLDTSIRVWDVKTGQSIHTLVGELLLLMIVILEFGALKVHTFHLSLANYTLLIATHVCLEGATGLIIQVRLNKLLNLENSWL